MSQGSEGFKLITVSQDEDDIVIQAGIRDECPVDFDVDDSSLLEVDSQAYALEENADEFVDGSDDYAYGQDVFDGECDDDPIAAEDASAPAPLKRKKWDGYETTAEDLVGTPMPMAQKATIIGGLLLLVFAVGYTVFFM